ncbi:MAG: DASS family sodium-coupled anion symporter [Proteobacteria bacterium]|nr:DASS family sodium-coupled anion symporter [Pseudomonadota bacterium]
MTENTQAAPSRFRKTSGLYLGGIFFGLILFMPTPEGMTPEAKRMAATVVLMGCWWIGESLPLGVTALVPLVAFPMLKIVPVVAVAPAYTNHYVFLLLGGFFIALTMQRWNLHTRIALLIIKVVGTSASRLVLGFMLASAFLSMWISNSATAMMMMPIGLGLILKTEEMQGTASGSSSKNFGACLMLGIAYASNIGGVSTLVGTFPNLVFAGMFKEHFPGGPEITFVEWMKIGLPFALIFVPVMWLYMVKGILPIKGKVIENADQIIQRELEKLGKMSRGEKMILGVFIVTAILWITRSDINLGDSAIRGWASRLGVQKYVHDSTVAMAMGILCFILPVDKERKVSLLNWEHANKAPWDILLLFGGGFAIAKGFQESGLTQWVGMQLSVLQGVSPIIIIAVVALTMTFLTEVTSNTASTTMMLPILAATAQAVNINPLLFMIPATISASCAFMLPIGTPPNAIVFASGRVSLLQMGKTGFLLNLITVVFVTAFVYLAVVPIMGISLEQPPVWIK